MFLCLHRVKAFSASHTDPPASRLGVHKKLGGDTARTADLNSPKGYSTPHDIMLSNKSWGKEEMFRVMAFVFSTVNVWWSPTFLEMAEHLPADGNY